jgi:crotonobetainyl-CoA:carnitine CoA-transferase CaiB-like acyl-CoA transferase
MSEQELPLEGVTVIECAGIFAGPWTGTLMGDFGAEVIKIEHPEYGDPLRDGLHDEQLQFKQMARNKKSVAIDLHTEEGQALVHDLVEDADVFLENFRPGTLEKWNLGWESLSETNPDLVMVRTTGFGQYGPYSDRPGFGTLAESMSGFAHLTGQADGPPTLPPFPLADAFAGLYSTFATMFALYWRDVNGGTGQYVDTSLLEPIFASLMNYHVIEHDQKGIVRERQGNTVTEYSVPRNAYKTNDDEWVALSASSPSIAERILRIVGGEEMAEDPRFQTHQDRVEHVDELDERIQEWMAERDREEIIEIFEENNAAIAPIYDIEDIYNDPHLEERDAILTVDDDDLGDVKVHGVFPKLSKTPGRVESTGPHLGEDTLEVLLDRTTASEDELESFYDEGIIKIGE